MVSNIVNCHYLLFAAFIVFVFSDTLHMIDAGIISTPNQSVCYRISHKLLLILLLGKSINNAVWDRFEKTKCLLYNIIIPIHKIGNQCDCNNYRPICNYVQESGMKADNCGRISY